MMLFCNSQLFDSTAPLFTAANRGFRYGDGLFETIKVLRGKVLLWPFHLERLQKGMAVLQMNGRMLQAGRLLEQIQELCIQNNCVDAARVRLAVYRTETNEAAYVLEAEPLTPEVFLLNERGWTLTLYPGVLKAPDILANLKTANYLLYALAGRYANQLGFDESLVCNTGGNICDGSRTNIFLLKKRRLFTPALEQGCVAGVMRRFLLDHCMHNNIPCTETALSVNDLIAADEILLTNAIQGIRWVSHFGERQYGHHFTKQLFDEALAGIYHQG